MNNREIYRQLIQEWNTGDFSRTHEWLAEDYKSHQPFEEIKTPGREGFKKIVTWFRTVFPDFVFTIDHMVSEDNRLVGRWTGRGTHKGDFLGVAATNKSVEFTGFDSIRIENGQVVEVWHQEDMVGLLRQLGVPGLPKITG